MTTIPQGATGPAGATGPQGSTNTGATGAQGPAGGISVGTVTTLSSGHATLITGNSSTTANLTLAFLTEVLALLVLLAQPVQLDLKVPLVRQPQGPQGETGAFGGATFEYLFSTSTSDADPGTGRFQ